MDQKVRKHTEKHKRLFNALAGIYGWGFGLQLRVYNRWINRITHLSSGSLLDIGCGTGAWAAAWHDRGWQVTAADPAARMIRVARRKNRHRPIEWRDLPDAPWPWDDNSFTQASAGMVLHGVKSAVRLNILRELKRTARERVIILDYNGVRGPLRDIVEWIEAGDYFHFQEYGLAEMSSVFEKVEIIPLPAGLAFYVCQ